MTSKKRRQRGSRTHGGGSHKNRRGAGNRGGRGDAGRDKHEFHNYDSLGKSGFSRPPDAVEEDPEEVHLHDVDAHLFYEVGTPGRLPETDVRIHARELVEGADSEDRVKVLGDGRTDNGAPSQPGLSPDGGASSISIPVEIVADEFTEPAKQRIETGGGSVVVDSGTDPAEIKASVGRHGIMLEKDQRTVDGAARLVGSGQELSNEVVDQLVEYAQETREYDDVSEVLSQNYRNKSKLEPIDVAKAYSFKIRAEENQFDTPELDRILDDYFADVELNDAAMSDLSEGLPESVPVGALSKKINYKRENIRDATVEVFDPDDMEEVDETISDILKVDLYLIKDRLEYTS